jgi:hypothetical protein
MAKKQVAPVGQPLYSRQVLNRIDEITTSPTANPIPAHDLVIPLPHPDPGQDIGILRSELRLRLHTARNQLVTGPYHLVSELRRESDQAVIGAVEFSIRPEEPEAFRVFLAEQMDTYEPNAFTLLAGDSLVLRAYVLGPADAIPISLGTSAIVWWINLEQGK